MSATDVYASSVFERAKAKVLYEAGRFLQKRDRILRMIDIAGLMQRKGESTGDADLATIAGKLRAKLDGLYSRQLQLEDSIRGALSGLSGQASGGALGLVQAALRLAPLLKQVATHVGGVKLAQKATDALKSRLLTGAELATLERPGVPASAGKWALAGVAVLGVWFIGRRRQ